MKRSGFTLIELMMALALFSFIAGGVAVFSVYYFRHYSFSFEENQSVSLAQSALTRIIKEVREARNGEDGAWAIVAADDNAFTFYADLTGDGRSDRVRYYVTGTTLMRAITEPTLPPVTYPAGGETVTTVVTGIDTSLGPVFGYYNGDWPGDTVNNPLPAGSRIADTKYVTVYLRININPNTGAAPYELTSGTSIRSLKDNL